MQVFAQNAFEGKTFFVTGASSGIGRATAILLAQHGARLVLSGRSEERLAETRQALPGEGHVVKVLSITDSESVSEVIRSLADTLGPFDGIFHAAGEGVVRPARMTKHATVEKVFSAAVHGAIGIGKAAATRNVMKLDGAALVFMSSVAAHRGQPGMTVYSAAKGAIESLVRGLACELASAAIRVNGIAAGAVETDMHQRLTNALPADSVADYQKRHPLGFGRGEDVANVAAFLLSDAARWITGATWIVDGGYLAR